MIVAMSEPEYEARARRELAAYIAAKLGLSHSITLACYADYPLEDLWRLGLAVYRCTRLPVQELPA